MADLRSRYLAPVLRLLEPEVAVMSSDSAATRLRYLDISHLEGPLVKPLDVRARAGESLGTFDGVVVDPEERRVRYLVVDRGWRFNHNRRLIPMPLASVDGEHN